MAQKKEDQAFVLVAQEQGLLDDEQVEALTARQRDEAKKGVHKSLAQLALEHDVISEQGLENVEAEMWVQSLPDRLDDYELVEGIGRGGMAAVFKAHDISLGKTVAVKVLQPRFSGSTTYLARFQREARLAAKLTHPNTCQALRTGNCQGIHYLVLEFVEGDSVSAILRQQGRMDEIAALDIALGVAHSLREAHGLGIIHRDVKPSNIVLSKWGVAKLTDFGIAKQISDIPDESVRRSLTMGVVGTPQYMSPEQVRGAKDIDARTDMYSLGATLYHMLIGHPPHDAETPQEAMYRVTATDPVDPQTRRPELGAATCDTVCQMLARRPADRFPDFDALIEALCEARRQAVSRAPKTRKSAPESETFHQPVPVTFPTGSTRGRQDARVSRILLTAGLVVLLGTAILFGAPRLKGCQADRNLRATPTSDE